MYLHVHVTSWMTADLLKVDDDGIDVRLRQSVEMMLVLCPVK